jgi:hypothetical protein
MPMIAPTRAVHRHAQDTDTSCGRACAQMVIASLAQGPPAGGSPTAAHKAAAVVVSQKALQDRETDPVDNVVTPSWYTHPDELEALLHGASELSAADQDWRVVSHSELTDLLADIVLALERGMPSIININSSDHWVVVVGAQVTNKGKLQSLVMLDPLPLAPLPHTYIDQCSISFDGVTVADPWRLSKKQLGDFDVQIGDVPPPPGMTDFSGQFLAIIHGAPTSGADLEIKGQEIAPDGAEPLPPPPSGGAGGGAHPLIAELAVTARNWNIPGLQDLLADDVTPVIRTVHDADGSASTYLLLSLFNDKIGRGVVATFDPNDKNALKHLRFVKSPLLPPDVDENLWWSQKPLRTLPSPYFPFRRPGGSAEAFERVFDKVTIKIEPQQL